MALYLRSKLELDLNFASSEVASYSVPFRGGLKQSKEVKESAPVTSKGLTVDDGEFYGAPFVKLK